MILHYTSLFLGAFVGSFLASLIILREKTTKEKLIEISVFSLFLSFIYLLIDFTLKK